jgi:hypothetical protein
MSFITGMANITIDKASSSEASSKPTNQQLLNQNTIINVTLFHESQKLH